MEVLYRTRNSFSRMKFEIFTLFPNEKEIYSSLGKKQKEFYLTNRAEALEFID